MNICKICNRELKHNDKKVEEKYPFFNFKKRTMHSSCFEEAKNNIRKINWISFSIIVVGLFFIIIGTIIIIIDKNHSKIIDFSSTDNLSGFIPILIGCLFILIGAFIHRILISKFKKRIRK